MGTFNKIIFYLFFFSILSPSALSYYNPGTPTGFVNDFARILTPEQRQSLEIKLSDFERESSNEISVVTISNLGGDTIENFAEKLFQDWGIGKKKNDNGILIFIAKDDRQMRIEVGYGLEGALTDAQSIWIINNEMRPAFQKGDFYQGINLAIDKIVASTKGEYIPSNGMKIPAGGFNILKKSFNELGVGIIFIPFIILNILGAILSKSKSFWLGGVIGALLGFILGIIFLSLAAGLTFGLVLGIIGLIFDFIVSRSPKYKNKGPWWLGGRGGFGGGFGGRSGGGFGGFGGGRSGGGGASGRW